MTKKGFSRIDYERQQGERFDILRLNLKVPKLALPKETSSHVRSAETEMLLAARTIIDELVKRLGRYGTKGAPAKGQELAEKED